jgi:hypothetical protein
MACSLQSLGCNPYHNPSQMTTAMNRFTAYICLILLLVTVPAWTQNGLERLTETLLHKAESSLASAEELVRSFHNRQADEWLKQAKQYFNEGQSAYSQKQFIAAQAKFRLVMDFCRRASDLVSKVPLNRMQEQVEELLRRAEQSVSANGDKESERLLSRARDHVRRAQRMAQQNQYQRGLEYLRIARFLLDQCLSWGESSKGDLREQALVEKERFEQLAQRSESALSGCSNPRAQIMFLQAQKQIPNINQALAQGEYKLAVQWYNNATRLLLRVVDLCQGRELSDREQTLEELEFLSQMIETARERFESRATPKEQIILQRASALYQQAVQCITADQYEVALRRIELARALITRLWNRDAAPQRLESEIERLMTDLDQARQAAGSDAQRPGQRAYWQAAEHHAQLAQRFYLANRPRAALVSLLVAERFLNMSRLAEAQTSSASAEQIKNELEKFADQLQQVSAAITDPEDQELYRSAQSLFERAQQFSQNQQWSLAASYLSMSRLILEKINS